MWILKDTVAAIRKEASIELGKWSDRLYTPEAHKSRADGCVADDRFRANGAFVSTRRIR